MSSYRDIGSGKCAVLGWGLSDMIGLLRKFSISGLTTLFIFLFVCTSMPTFSRVAVAQTIVQRIIIKGNHYIAESSIREYLGFTVGTPYSEFQASASLKRLYGIGAFSDVQIGIEGDALIVSVVENPLVNIVVFEGNKDVGDEKLFPQIKTKAHAVLKRADVQRDAEQILRVYATMGYHAARIVPSIIELPGNRVNLVFEIDEGNKATIGEVIFVGNNSFSRTELLRQITTAATGFLSWFRMDDIYSPDRVEWDKEALSRFYLHRGYVDFRVSSAIAELDRERDKFIVTFTIEEGPRYKFGEVKLKSSIVQLDLNSVVRAVSTVEGDVYDAEKVDNSLEDLTIEMSRLGYPFAQVRVEDQRDPEGHSVGLTYVIEEGQKAYVERIEIRGNTRTQDRVIRREFDIFEGDPFNFVMIDRARRALRGLGFFQNVKVTTEKGSSPDRVVVIVDVAEQPTGQFSVTGGYGTADGFSADISVTERNLLGAGQYVKLAVMASGQGRGFEIAFVEPYFLDRRMSLGAEIFGNTRTRSSSIAFGKSVYGVSLSLGFPLSSDVWFRPRYQFQRETIFDVGDSASLAIKDAEGVKNKSQIGYTLTFDTLDDRRDPRNGIHATFSQDLAGVGGDVHYIRTAGRVSIFNEIYDDIVGILRLNAGYISSTSGEKGVSISDSFFKGGDFIRGFAQAGLGPRDQDTLDALGGKWFAGLTAEVQFPFSDRLTDLGIKGAVFSDVGVLSGTDLVGREIAGRQVHILDSAAIRSSVGGSVLWDSPFGPLRMDWAYVLSKESYDKEQRFRFGVEKNF